MGKLLPAHFDENQRNAHTAGMRTAPCMHVCSVGLQPAEELFGFASLVALAEFDRIMPGSDQNVLDPPCAFQTTFFSFTVLTDRLRGWHASEGAGWGTSPRWLAISIVAGWLGSGSCEFSFLLSLCSIDRMTSEIYRLIERVCHGRYKYLTSSFSFSFELRM